MERLFGRTAREFARVLRRVWDGTPAEEPAKGTLGRWRVKSCDEEVARHVFLQNRDHCGDVLCGAAPETEPPPSPPASERRAEGGAGEGPGRG